MPDDYIRGVEALFLVFLCRFISSLVGFSASGLGWHVYESMGRHTERLPGWTSLRKVKLAIPLKFGIRKHGFYYLLTWVMYSAKD